VPTALVTFLACAAFVAAVVVALCDGVAVVLVDTAGVDDGVVAIPIADEPAIAKPLVVDNCGGVIAKTAPRPPKVPPAISNPRFISCLDSKPPKGFTSHI